MENEKKRSAFLERGSLPSARNNSLYSRASYRWYYENSNRSNTVFYSICFSLRASVSRPKIVRLKVYEPNVSASFATTIWTTTISLYDRNDSLSFNGYRPDDKFLFASNEIRSASGEGGIAPKSTVFVSGPTMGIIVYGPLLYSVRRSVAPAPPYSLIVNYSNIPRFQGHPIYRLALSTPRAALVQVGRSSNRVYSIPTHSRNRYYHEICIKLADFTLCVRFSLDSTDDIAFF